MKHLVIGQHQKAPNFSAFHWSPHGSLVDIGQHFLTTNTNTEIEIKADLNTESDQAMRGMHSCNSWLFCDFLNKTDNEEEPAQPLTTHFPQHQKRN